MRLSDHSAEGTPLIRRLHRVSRSRRCGQKIADGDRNIRKADGPYGQGLLQG
jgi:hypothetical protein